MIREKRQNPLPRLTALIHSIAEYRYRTYLKIGRKIGREVDSSR